MRYNDINKIEKLLEAFYEGNTTPWEEKMLYDFFSQTNIPKHLHEEKAFFQKLNSLQPHEIPMEMENRLETLIDKLEAEEKEKSTILHLSPNNSRKINWKWVGSIAASLLIILSTGIFTYNKKLHHKNHMLVDTFSDPEEAYVETEKALLFVSNKLNKGFDQMENLQKNIQKTNKIIEKNVHL